MREITKIISGALAKLWSMKELENVVHVSFSCHICYFPLHLLSFEPTAAIFCRVFREYTSCGAASCFFFDADMSISWGSFKNFV